MSKHLKIFVSVLFMVIIILAIGITRFYFDVSKDTQNNSDSPVIYSKSEPDENGLCVFESSDNLFGVIDKNEKVIIEPRWLSVDFTGNGCFIVSESFDGEILFGCVDSEENTIVPFIYSTIDEFGTYNKKFYAARVAENNSYIIYDDNFRPCFDRVWNRCDIDGNSLTLYYKRNTFSYFAGSDGLEMKSAIVNDTAAGVDYTVSFFSRVLLSKLDYESLEKICSCISAYLEYSMNGDSSVIQPYLNTGNQQNFRMFFSNTQGVFARKLKSVNDISVYFGKKDDGTQYVAASVAVNADVAYMEGETDKAVSGKYHAVIKFDVDEFGVNMISASFTDDVLKEIPQ